MTRPAILREDERDELADTPEAAVDQAVVMEDSLREEE
jgi:hypothetical protein